MVVCTFSCPSLSAISKRLRNAQNNPFAASDAVQDSNRRMMTFADLLLHPAANRELSVLEGESSD